MLHPDSGGRLPKVKATAKNDTERQHVIANSPGIQEEYLPSFLFI